MGIFCGKWSKNGFFLFHFVIIIHDSEAMKMKPKWVENWFFSLAFKFENDATYVRWGLGENFLTSKHELWLALSLISIST